eukprot:GFYU01007978.1.p1 GENE.GFYU01007978.1~~GFYU01007978.1.p1  ORF type:complete len:1066 (-),score=264.08 GFYU01007978.1:74-3157(-)
MLASQAVPAPPAFTSPSPDPRTLSLDMTYDENTAGLATAESTSPVRMPSRGQSRGGSRGQSREQARPIQSRDGLSTAGGSRSRNTVSAGAASSVVRSARDVGSPPVLMRPESRLGTALNQHVQNVINLNLPRLSKLFQDPHSEGLVDRHLAAIQRICSVCKEGFFFADLEYINPILSFCEQAVRDGNDAYIESLIGLIGICGVPGIKRTASEEHRSFYFICEMLHRMCTMAQFPRTPEVQKAAAAVLLSIIQMGREQEKCGTPTLNLRAVENVGIVSAVVAAMKTSPAEETEDVLVQILWQLSFLREMVFVITREGGLEVVVSVLAGDFRSNKVYVAMELIWNCLDQDPHATDIMGSWHSVNVLKDLFVRIVTEGYKMKDKEMRNEILVIASLVSTAKANQHIFLDTGFLHLMLLFATATELNLTHELIKPFALTKAQVDFEFKKLLLQIVGVLCENEGNLAVAIECNFVPVLLLYIDETGQNHPAVVRWSAVQIKELQLLAMNVLVNLVLLCPGEFARHDGLKIALQFFRSCADAKFRRSGSRLILNASTLSDMREELGAMGVIEMMLEIAKSTQQATRNRIDAVTTLSYLCKDYEPNQMTFAQEGGITILREMLKLNPVMMEYDQLLIAAVDCTWNAIIPNPPSMERWLKLDGLDHLLTLLEFAPYIMRNQLLSVLSDILEFGNTVTGFREWKSEKTGQRMAQILVGFWEAEEERLGQGREGSVVENVQRPLEGYWDGQQQDPLHLQLTLDRFTHRNLRNTTMPLHTVNQTVLDAVHGQDMKAKIYSVFVKAGFDKYDFLDTSQQVKLRLIANYQVFKEGEVWSDITKELREEGVRPVTPDQRFLDDQLQANVDRFDGLKHEQETLYGDRHDHDLEEEQAFFETISMIYEQKQEELKYAAFSTKPSALMRSKARLPTTKEPSALTSTSFEDGSNRLDTDRSGGDDNAPAVGTGTGTGTMDGDGTAGAMSISGGAPGMPLSPSAGTLAMESSSRKPENEHEYIEGYLADTTVNQLIGDELVKALHQ